MNVEDRKKELTAGGGDQSKPISPRSREDQYSSRLEQFKNESLQSKKMSINHPQEKKGNMDL